MQDSDKQGNPTVEISSDILEEAENAVDPKKTEDKEQEYYDKFVRLTADFDNYRKRIQKEKTQYIKYGNENLLHDLLPILDNFERALDSSQDSDAKSILEGVRMIYGQLSSNLASHGLQAKSTVGQPFDPNMHEAMSHVESDQAQAGTVLQEHQKMYMYHDKLLRPALVTVAKEMNNDDASDSEDDA
jgi:molecular chaperone GrpE